MLSTARLSLGIGWFTEYSVTLLVVVWASDCGMALRLPYGTLGATWLNRCGVTLWVWCGSLCVM